MYCYMKSKDNKRIIVLYEKLQLNAYKRLFDNEYFISIHDINSYHVYEISFSDT